MRVCPSGATDGRSMLRHPGFNVTWCRNRFTCRAALPPPATEACIRSGAIAETVTLPSTDDGLLYTAFKYDWSTAVTAATARELLIATFHRGVGGIHQGSVFCACSWDS